MLEALLQGDQDPRLTPVELLAACDKSPAEVGRPDTPRALST